MKPLYFPKLIHLIRTIPNPSPSMINSQIFFFNDFLERKKYNIKKNVIQDYEDGGLKMSSYADFIKALKSIGLDVFYTQ